MSDLVVQAHRLTRYFGQKCAVEDVSFGVPRGSVTALLGRNGSGKTTLLRMLMGMLQPTRGHSIILGQNSDALSPATRERIAYIAEGHPLYGWMSIGQLARHQSRLYAHWNQDVYHRILDHFELSEKASAGRLSRGQTAGVSLAIALAPEPELLILDDPSLGLDPVARRAILEVIVDLCGDGRRTVLLSTHELQDVERIADRVLLLDRSVLLADAEKDYFLSRISEYVIEGASVIPAVPGLVSSRRAGERLHLLVANAETTPSAISELNLPFEQRPVTLEDAVIGYLSRRGRLLDETKGGAR